MSPHQVIAVGARLFAIWLAIYVARSVPTFFREAAKADATTFTAVVVFSTLLMVLVILGLWLFPKTVARGLLSTEEVITNVRPTPDMWFAVGCALIGLWLIVPAVTSIIYNLSVLFAAQRDPTIDATDFHMSWAYYVAEIAFGVWLLLGARGARRLFWWARGVGQ
jgi:hypothetical protein